MDINVETAKRMLKKEVENAPYVIEESFGNAGTYRKLISFFVAVVKDDTVSREDAKEWLCSLFFKQSPKEHELFKVRVDSILTALEYLYNTKMVVL